MCWSTMQACTSNAWSESPRVGFERPCAAAVQLPAGYAQHGQQPHEQAEYWVWPKPAGPILGDTASLLFMHNELNSRRTSQLPRQLCLDVKLLAPEVCLLVGFALQAVSGWV
jgi:hypothetical protein